jgi:hypothetical protein
LAGRTDYSHDEWMELRRAMMGAAVLVSLAEGGGEDMIPEMLAVSEHLLSARRSHKSQLCRELADIQRFQSGFQAGMSVAEYEGPALESISAAMKLVATRTPSESRAFREFLIGLAETAANAHKEGSFMGIGGSRISQAEAAAIAKVKRALDQP